MTTATPLQRAISRAAAGADFGDLLPEAERVQYLGTPLARLPVPSLIVLVCGIRSGKSVIAGAAALHSALTANLSRLPTYERARVPIVAPTVDTAQLTFRLLTGAIEAAPALKALVVPRPSGKDVGTNTITVRRDDGRLVDIVVVAALRGGIAIRGSWLAGFVLEETAFFGADATGYKVNAEELLRAAQPRLVPGGQGWIISSPMAEEGLLYDLWKTHFGIPGDVLIVHAPTLAMNNVTVDAATVASIRKRDPDGAAREYDAIFVSGLLVLIPSVHLDAAFRKADLVIPYEEGHWYTARMDPATRGNAWTLGIGTKARREDKVKTVIVLAMQWIGSKTKPLSPDVVLREQAEILRRYHLTVCATDQYAADANRDIARRHGLTLYDKAMTHAENTDIYESLRTTMADDGLECPDDPYIRADLRGLKKKIGNTISIVLPRTPDGRHCDYAPVIAGINSTPMRDPPPVVVVLSEDEAKAKVQADRRAEAMRQAEKRQSTEDRRLRRAMKKGNWKALV